MALSQEFMKAVNAGDMLSVHIMLKNSLTLDPSAKEFDEMASCAIEELGDIYDDHDGETLNLDQTFWTDDYFNQEMYNVVNNFSKERVNLLKDMDRYLNSDKITSNVSKPPYSGDYSSTTNISRKQVGIGISAAGAVLAVAGLCTSHTALTVGGVVVAVAGVALIVSDK